MKISIRDVANSFEYLFDSFYRKDFIKTHRFTKGNEREVLPLVRWYLLGCYEDRVYPEFKARLQGSPTGNGYIDFVIDDIAVEFAVRTEKASKASISATVQTTEMKKLMKYDGKALLVLFDFSDSPYSESEIEEFRNIPSLGKGNHKLSAFNLAYFYVASRRPFKTDKILKNIRI
ncbi:hypothetical protein EDY93_18610 [Salmonella enterica]|nr:hypothetical protein [Salmonella enterica]EDW0581187.1 hypothetical protein [Salmonella enterica subsp. enterica serovar Poona]EBD0564736.1 hypothetical protein [Salmonella enterica]EBD1341637.1 hypothetical protein [Salmonella enterica]EBI2536817.1 hypothetical protein [Salmonella enterica]